MGYCRECEKRWMSKSECHCSGCHKHFKSEYAFNKHRTGAGRFRRCMKTVEMDQAGMLLDTGKGYWISERMREGVEYSKEQSILLSVSEISGDEIEKTMFNIVFG